MKKVIQLAVVYVVLAFSSGGAEAGLMRVDLFESEDLPAYGSSGPRTFNVDNRVIGVGEELTIADQTANPSGWNGFLSIDLTASTLTVTHRENFTDFQIASILVDDIVFSTFGESISNVTLITRSIINAGNSAPFTETITFTGNSIRLDWSVNDIPGMDLFNYVSGGSATYQIETEIAPAVVPEPSSLAVFSLGACIAGIWAPRCRKRTK